MSSKLGFAIVLLLVAGVSGFYLSKRSSPDPIDEQPSPPVASEDQDVTLPSFSSDSNRASEAAETDENSYASDSGESKVDPSFAEPLDIQQFRAVRGYYASGSSDISQMHPYELYDLETLEQLVANDDGLAQLVLADKIAIDDPKRADELYLAAAVNGKSAALVNLASSRLVAVPGGTDWGFPLTTSSGQISDEYIDVLKFYVAAEATGDVIATEVLTSHIEAMGAEITESDLERLCQAGRELADQIRAEQIKKWGASKEIATPISSQETLAAVCAI